MSNLRRVGAEAEDRAAEFLLGLGYTIVTRRFKSSRGEIDIVAYDGDTLVFVEVKSRRSPGAVPEEGVDAKKAAHLSAAVAEYLHKTGAPDVPCRFDIIAVTPDDLRHHVAAFRPQTRS
ncbi:MAG TPA: YraN family protein [Fimbriimonadaceae bacterium]|nr:YraN family protein [Fimbriimonadaceae bacterium]